MSLQSVTLVSYIVRKAEHTSLLMRWPFRSSEIRPVLVPSALPSAISPGRPSLLSAKLRWKSEELWASTSESLVTQASLSMQFDMLSAVSLVLVSSASARLFVICTDLLRHTLDPARLTSCVRRWSSSMSLSVETMMLSLAYMRDAMACGEGWPRRRTPRVNWRTKCAKLCWPMSSHVQPCPTGCVGLWDELVA